MMRDPRRRSPESSRRRRRERRDSREQPVGTTVSSMPGPSSQPQQYPTSQPEPQMYSQSQYPQHYADPQRYPEPGSYAPRPDQYNESPRYGDPQRYPQPERYVQTESYAHPLDQNTERDRYAGPSAQGHHETERMRPRGGSSSSSSSSTSSSFLNISAKSPRFGGVFSTFFRAPSEQRKRRRRKKQKARILSFGNSSSSSVNSDLAYGRGYIERDKSQRGSPMPPGHPGLATPTHRSEPVEARQPPAPPQPPAPRSKTDEEILEIGRQLQDIARRQNDADLRAAGKSRSAQLAGVAGVAGAAAAFSHFRRNNKGDSKSRGANTSKPGESGSSSDDDWESASEDESSSDGSDAGLAYGSEIKPSKSARISSEPPEQIKPPERKSTVVDPRLFGPYNSLRGAVKSPCGFGEQDPRSAGSHRRHHEETVAQVQSPKTGKQPMQRVFPVPTSDPDKFDYDRGSVTSSRQELPQHSRPSPVPLQQPIPIVPVSSKVYDAERFVEEESRNSKRSPPKGRSAAETAIAGVGVAAAAIGAAMASNRRDSGEYVERRDDRRSEIPDRRDGHREYREGNRHEDRTDRPVRIELEDHELRNQGDPRQAYRHSNVDIIDDRDKRRVTRDDVTRESKKRELETDSRPEVYRLPQGDEIRVEYDPNEERRRREEPKERRREDRKPEVIVESRDAKRVEKPTELPRDYQGVEQPKVPIAQAPIDPFQFQVADDAFQTPKYTTPKNATPKRPLTPQVVTVDREPNFDDSPPRKPDYSDARMSRKDSFELEQRLEQYQQGFRDRDRTPEPRRRGDSFEEEQHAARSIYDEAKHATAPISAAAVASAIAVELERSHKHRNDHVTEDGSRDRTQAARDAVQEEADKYYREMILARKIAEDEIRSRSASPHDKSVVGKWEDQEGPEVVTIVTPPEMDHPHDKSPYDAPNADVRIDHVIIPDELSRFRLPTDQLASGSTSVFRTRDPSCERERPLLNLVLPTPIVTPRATPAPEQQQESRPITNTQDSPAETRSAAASGVSAHPSSGTEVVVGPKDEVIERPTTPAAKSVTWGENETKSFEVESPEPPKNAPSSSSTKSKKRIGKSSPWGIIAAAIGGSGAAAAATAAAAPEIRDPFESETENKEKHSPPQSPKSRAIEHSPEPGVAPASPNKLVTAFDKDEDLPPAPGPKPSSPRVSQMPGSFADDLEFASVLAAGLQDTGFDPNIVIDNPTYMRRDSPPGQNEPGLYQQPFAETVTDLGIYGPEHVHDDPSARKSGFVVGEVPDSPVAEKDLKHDHAVFESPRGYQHKGKAKEITDSDQERAATEFEPSRKLSKKEKRRQKAAKRQSIENVHDDVAYNASEVAVRPEPAPLAEGTTGYDWHRSYNDVPQSPETVVALGPKARGYADVPSWDLPASSHTDHPSDRPTAHDYNRSIDEPTSSYRTRSFDEPSSSYTGHSFDNTPSYDTTTSDRPPVDDDVTVPTKLSKKQKKKNRSSKSDVVIVQADDGMPQEETAYSESRPSREKLPESEEHASTEPRKTDEDAIDTSIKKKKKSKKSKQSSDEWTDVEKQSDAPSLIERSTPTMAFDDWDDRPPKSRRDRSRFEDRDVSSVVSDPASRLERSDRRSNGTRYEDGDDVKSVASDGAGRKRRTRDDKKSPKDEEKRSSSSFFSLFRPGGVSSKDTSGKDEKSFLDNAGTLGAGAGLASAVAALGSMMSRSNAAEPRLEESSDVPRSLEGVVSPSEDAEVLDPEITQRTVRPAIDPQYGDFLPLPPSPMPPSTPGFPTQELSELPALPDSRPETPPNERRRQHELKTHVRRRSNLDTPSKSPSQTAVPFKLRLGQRSTPSSPGNLAHVPSPVPSPTVPTAPETTLSRRPSVRPISWESSREIKPLYLLEHARQEHAAQSMEPPIDLPELPPSEPSSRESPAPEFALRENDVDYFRQLQASPFEPDELRINTDMSHFPTSTGYHGPQETTPKAKEALQYTGAIFGLASPALPDVPDAARQLELSEHELAELPSLPASPVSPATERELVDLPALPASPVIEPESVAFPALPASPVTKSQPVEASSYPTFVPESPALPSLPDAAKQMHLTENELAALPPLPTSPVTEQETLPVLPSEPIAYNDVEYLPALPVNPVTEEIAALPVGIDFVPESPALPAVPDAAKQLDLSHQLEELPALPASPVTEEIAVLPGGIDFVPESPALPAISDAAKQLDLSEQFLSEQLEELPALPASPMVEKEMAVLPPSVYFAPESPALPAVPDADEQFDFPQQLEELPALPASPVTEKGMAVLPTDVYFGPESPALPAIPDAAKQLDLLHQLEDLPALPASPVVEEMTGLPTTPYFVPESPALPTAPDAVKYLHLSEQLEELPALPASPVTEKEMAALPTSVNFASESPALPAVPDAVKQLDLSQQLEELPALPVSPVVEEMVVLPAAPTLAPESPALPAIPDAAKRLDIAEQLEELPALPVSPVAESADSRTGFSLATESSSLPVVSAAEKQPDLDERYLKDLPALPASPATSPAAGEPEPEPVEAMSKDRSTPPSPTPSQPRDTTEALAGIEDVNLSGARDVTLVALAGSTAVGLAAAALAQDEKAGNEPKEAESETKDSEASQPTDPPADTKLSKKAKKKKRKSKGMSVDSPALATPEIASSSEHTDKGVTLPTADIVLPISTDDKVPSSDIALTAPAEEPTLPSTEISTLSSTDKTIVPLSVTGEFRHDSTEKDVARSIDMAPAALTDMAGPSSTDVIVSSPTDLTPPTTTKLETGPSLPSGTDNVTALADSLPIDVPSTETPIIEPLYCEVPSTEVSAADVPVPESPLLKSGDQDALPSADIILPTPENNDLTSDATRSVSPEDNNPASVEPTQPMASVDRSYVPEDVPVVSGAKVMVSSSGNVPVDHEVPTTEATVSLAAAVVESAGPAPSAEDLSAEKKLSKKEKKKLKKAQARGLELDNLTDLSEQSNKAPSDLEPSAVSFPESEPTGPLPETEVAVAPSHSAEIPISMPDMEPTADATEVEQIIMPPVAETPVPETKKSKKKKKKGKKVSDADDESVAATETGKTIDAASESATPIPKHKENSINSEETPNVPEPQDRVPEQDRSNIVGEASAEPLSSILLPESSPIALDGVTEQHTPVQDFVEKLAIAEEPPSDLKPSAAIEKEESSGLEAVVSDPDFPAATHDDQPASVDEGLAEHQTRLTLSEEQPITVDIDSTQPVAALETDAVLATLDNSPSEKEALLPEIGQTAQETPAEVHGTEVSAETSGETPSTPTSKKQKKKKGKKNQIVEDESTVTIDSKPADTEPISRVDLVSQNTDMTPHISSEPALTESEDLNAVAKLADNSDALSEPPVLDVANPITSIVDIPRETSEPVSTEPALVAVPLAEDATVATAEVFSATGDNETAPFDPARMDTGPALAEPPQSEQSGKKKKKKKKGKGASISQLDDVIATETTSIESSALAVESPVVEAPVVEAPVAETPTVETSATRPSTAEVPAVETPTVETPTVETPTVETPTVETPTVETPTVEIITAEPSTTEAPVVETPVIEAPVVEVPTIEISAPESSTEVPVVETPTVETITAEPSTAEIPAVETPVIETPVVETPTVETRTVEASATEPSATEPSASEKPAVETPVIENPVVETPIVETPTAETPTVETPTVETPTVETPMVETPTVETPTVETPTVETPTAETPTVETPTVETPTVEIITAEPSTTEAPVVKVPRIEISAPEFSTEFPVVETPTVENPVVETPIVETPTVETSTPDPSTTEAPVVKVPTIEISAPEFSTEFPVVETPTVETTTAEPSTAETPAVETPVVETSITETPSVETSAAESSTTEDSVVKTPVIEAPVIETPMVETITAEPPATEIPAVETPVVENLLAETPTIETPALDNTAEKPAAENPVVKTPTVELSDAEKSIVDTPVPEALTVKKASIESLTSEVPFAETTTDAKTKDSVSIDEQLAENALPPVQVEKESSEQTKVIADTSEVPVPSSADYSEQNPNTPLPVEELVKSSKKSKKKKKKDKNVLTAESEPPALVPDVSGGSADTIAQSALSEKVVEGDHADAQSLDTHESQTNPTDASLEEQKAEEDSQVTILESQEPTAGQIEESTTPADAHLPLDQDGVPGSLSQEPTLLESQTEAIDTKSQEPLAENEENQNVEPSVEPDAPITSKKSKKKKKKEAAAAAAAAATAALEASVEDTLQTQDDNAEAKDETSTDNKDSNITSDKMGDTEQSPQEPPLSGEFASDSKISEEADPGPAVTKKGKKKKKGKKSSALDPETENSPSTSIPETTADVANTMDKSAYISSPTGELGSDALPSPQAGTSTEAEWPPAANTGESKQKSVTWAPELESFANSPELPSLEDDDGSRSQSGAANPPTSEQLPRIVPSDPPGQSDAADLQGTAVVREAQGSKTIDLDQTAAPVADKDLDLDSQAQMHPVGQVGQALPQQRDIATGDNLPASTELTVTRGIAPEPIATEQIYLPSANRMLLTTASMDDAGVANRKGGETLEREQDAEQEVSGEADTTSDAEHAGRPGIIDKPSASTSAQTGGVGIMDPSLHAGVEPENGLGHDKSVVDTQNGRMTDAQSVGPALTDSALEAGDPQNTPVRVLANQDTNPEIPQPLDEVPRSLEVGKNSDAGITEAAETFPEDEELNDISNVGKSEQKKIEQEDSVPLAADAELPGQTDTSEFLGEPIASEQQLESPSETFSDLEPTGVVNTSQSPDKLEELPGQVADVWSEPSGSNKMSKKDKKKNKIKAAAAEKTFQDEIQEIKAQDVDDGPPAVLPVDSTELAEPALTPNVSSSLNLAPMTEAIEAGEDEWAIQPASKKSKKDKKKRAANQSAEVTVDATTQGEEPVHGTPVIAEEKPQPQPIGSHEASNTDAVEDEHPTLDSTAETSMEASGSKSSTNEELQTVAEGAPEDDRNSTHPVDDPLPDPVAATANEQPHVPQDTDTTDFEFPTKKGKKSKKKKQQILDGEDAQEVSNHTVQVEQQPKYEEGASAVPPADTVSGDTEPQISEDAQLPTEAAPEMPSKASEDDDVNLTSDQQEAATTPALGLQPITGELDALQEGSQSIPSTTVEITPATQTPDISTIDEPLESGDSITKSLEGPAHAPQTTPETTGDNTPAHLEDEFTSITKKSKKDKKKKKKGLATPDEVDVARTLEPILEQAGFREEQPTSGPLNMQTAEPINESTEKKVVSEDPITVTDMQSLRPEEPTVVDEGPKPVEEDAPISKMSKKDKKKKKKNAAAETTGEQPTVLETEAVPDQPAAAEVDETSLPDIADSSNSQEILAQEPFATHEDTLPTEDLPVQDQHMEKLADDGDVAENELIDQKPIDEKPAEDTSASAAKKSKKDKKKKAAAATQELLSETAAEPENLPDVVSLPDSQERQVLDVSVDEQLPKTDSPGDQVATADNEDPSIAEDIQKTRVPKLTEGKDLSQSETIVDPEEEFEVPQKKSKKNKKGKKPQLDPLIEPETQPEETITSEPVAPSAAVEPSTPENVGDGENVIPENTPALEGETDEKERAGDSTSVETNQFADPEHEFPPVGKKAKKDKKKKTESAPTITEPEPEAQYPTANPIETEKSIGAASTLAESNLIEHEAADSQKNDPPPDIQTTPAEAEDQPRAFAPEAVIADDEFPLTGKKAKKVNKKKGKVLDLTEAEPATEPATDPIEKTAEQLPAEAIDISADTRADQSEQHKIDDEAGDKDPMETVQTTSDTAKGTAIEPQNPRLVDNEPSSPKLSKKDKKKKKRAKQQDDPSSPSGTSTAAKFQTSEMPDEPSSTAQDSQHGDVMTASLEAAPALDERAKELLVAQVEDGAAAAPETEASAIPFLANPTSQEESSATTIDLQEDSAALDADKEFHSVTKKSKKGKTDKSLKEPEAELPVSMSTPSEELGEAHSAAEPSMVKEPEIVESLLPEATDIAVDPVSESTAPLPENDSPHTAKKSKKDKKKKKGKTVDEESLEPETSKPVPVSEGEEQHLATTADTKEGLKAMATSHTSEEPILDPFETSTTPFAEDVAEASVEAPVVIGKASEEPSQPVEPPAPEATSVEQQPGEASEALATADPLDDEWPEAASAKKSKNSSKKKESKAQGDLEENPGSAALLEMPTEEAQAEAATTNDTTEIEKLKASDDAVTPLTIPAEVEPEATLQDDIIREATLEEKQLQPSLANQLGEQGAAAELLSSAPEPEKAVAEPLLVEEPTEFIVKKSKKDKKKKKKGSVDEPEPETIAVDSEELPVAPQEPVTAVIVNTASESAIVEPATPGTAVIIEKTPDEFPTSEHEHETRDPTAESQEQVTYLTKSVDVVSESQAVAVDEWPEVSDAKKSKKDKKKKKKKGGSEADGQAAEPSLKLDSTLQSEVKDPVAPGSDSLQADNTVLRVDDDVAPEKAADEPITTDEDALSKTSEAIATSELPQDLAKVTENAEVAYQTPPEETNAVAEGALSHEPSAEEPLTEADASNDRIAEPVLKGVSDNAADEFVGQTLEKSVEQVAEPTKAVDELQENFVVKKSKKDKKKKRGSQALLDDNETAVPNYTEPAAPSPSSELPLKSLELEETNQSSPDINDATRDLVAEGTVSKKSKKDKKKAKALSLANEPVVLPEEQASFSKAPPALGDEELGVIHQAPISAEVPGKSKTSTQKVDTILGADSPQPVSQSISTLQGLDAVVEKDASEATRSPAEVSYDSANRSIGESTSKLGFDNDEWDAPMVKSKRSKKGKKQSMVSSHEAFEPSGTVLQPAQETSSVVHEVPFDQSDKRKKIKTEEQSGTLLPEPILSSQDIAAAYLEEDVSHDNSTASETIKDLGKSSLPTPAPESPRSQGSFEPGLVRRAPRQQPEESLPRDITASSLEYKGDHDPVETAKPATPESQHQGAESVTAAGVAAIAAGAAALISKSASEKKKEKKKSRYTDKRTSQEDDMFDDPSLWEGADKKHVSETASEEVEKFWGGIDPDNKHIQEPSVRTDVMDGASNFNTQEQQKSNRDKALADDDVFAPIAVVAAGAQPSYIEADDSTTSRNRDIAMKEPLVDIKPTADQPSKASVSRSLTEDNHTEEMRDIGNETKNALSLTAPLREKAQDDIVESPILGREPGTEPPEVIAERNDRSLTTHSESPKASTMVGELDEAVDRGYEVETRRELSGGLPSESPERNFEASGFRSPVPSILPPVQEEAHEDVETQSRSLPKTASRGALRTPEPIRDSGFVAGSPNPLRRSGFDGQERERDSGVLRDWQDTTLQGRDAKRTPEPSSHRERRRSREAERVKSPAVKDVLRRSPFAEGEARDYPLSRTPVLREPSARELTPTPEPHKQRRISPELERRRSKYQDLASAALAGAAISSTSTPRSTPPPGNRSVSERVALLQSPASSEPPVARRSISNSSLSRHRRAMGTPTPEPLVFRPESPGISRPGTATPPLRRVDRRMSGDLRSLSQRSQQDLTKDPTSSSKTPVANEGRVRTKDMADVYDGFGEGRIGSPRSPTRPHSMRRRQSMQVLELESRVEQLMAENRMLADARTHADSHNNNNRASGILAERDAEIDVLKQSLEFLQKEVARLTEVNEGLNSANTQLAAQHNERYRSLETQHADASRQLEEVRNEQGYFQESLLQKDAEIGRLRSELDAAKDKIREMQRQILATKGADADFLNVKDVDHFDHRCQQLCSHVQQWVLRFSKFSDMRACRLTNEINDEKVIDRLDNAILDGTDVDTYLGDRVRRRDVFMSMTMNMIWEFVFTRYLFGMDREQRQKLKSLEKLLTEVGPAQAVRQWRAVTLTLLSKRPSFKHQRDLDTEAVVQAIFQTLSKVLPPPSNLEDQIQSQLRRVMREAVDLSIEMRTQRAEYMMLPPLQPEYDADGELADTVTFNAALMNERSGDKSVTNEALEAQNAVVRVVLFPLVVKKGDDAGNNDEEIVVCPAQVLVARSKGKSARLSTPGSDVGTGSVGGNMAAMHSELSMGTFLPERASNK